MPRNHNIQKQKIKKNQKQHKKQKNIILTAITKLTPQNDKLFWKSF